MKCFICERTQEEVLLLSVPCEVIYKSQIFEVLGNMVDGEYICMPCVGYQWDEIDENAL